MYENKSEMQIQNILFSVSAFAHYHTHIPFF